MEISELMWAKASYTTGKNFFIHYSGLLLSIGFLVFNVIGGVALYFRLYHFFRTILVIYIANVLIFPNLEAANVAYKLLQRLGGAETIGPVLLGMGKPIHVLQRGDEVRSIVNMAAMAVVDAQSRE